MRSIVLLGDESVWINGLALYLCGIDWPACWFITLGGGGGAYNHAVCIEDLGEEAENDRAERMLFGPESRCASV